MDDQTCQFIKNSSKDCLNQTNENVNQTSHLFSDGFIWTGKNVFFSTCFGTFLCK